MFTFKIDYVETKLPFPRPLLFKELGSSSGLLLRRQFLVGILFGSFRLGAHAAHPIEGASPARQV